MSASFEINYGINAMATRLENRAKLLRIAAESSNKEIVDWNAVRYDLEEGFDQLLALLYPEEDEVLDEIEGEEELETELHPLDPDNGDEWHEGFDDV